MFYDNAKNLKPFRKSLRKNATDAERKLWSKLRNKQLMGFKFHRQYSIQQYILDFYCPEKRLAIELDGSHHAEDETREYDQNRTNELQAHNIKVLRFWNSEVTSNINAVIETIVVELEKKILI